MTLSFWKEILHYLGVIFLLWDKGRDKETLRAPEFVMVWGVCCKLAIAHRVEMAALGLISFPNCWLLWSPNNWRWDDSVAQMWSSGNKSAAVRILWLILDSYLPNTARGRQCAHRQAGMLLWADVFSHDCGIQKEFHDGSKIPRGLKLLRGAIPSWEAVPWPWKRQRKMPTSKA